MFLLLMHKSSLVIYKMKIKTLKEGPPKCTMKKGKRGKSDIGCILVCKSQQCTNQSGHLFPELTPAVQTEETASLEKTEENIFKTSHTFKTTHI